VIDRSAGESPVATEYNRYNSPVATNYNWYDAPK
jgi:hypothetical protein